MKSLVRFLPAVARLRNGCWVVCVAAMAIGNGCTNIESTTYRGRQVRTETERTDHQLAFTCALARSADSTPRLLITKHDLVTYHEVPVYQKVLELRAPEDIDRDSIDHQVVEGEYMRGRPAIRNEDVEVGPWKDEAFLLDGKDKKTDAKGLISDSEQDLLVAFDDLSVTECRVQVAHAELGRVGLRITRDELLSALGVNADVRDKAKASRDGVTFTLACPDSATAGGAMDVTLTVTNRGQGMARHVMARTFSREPWFNGKMLYIGDLAPGQRRSFSRRIKLPATARRGTLFGAVGIWDLLGAVPEKRIPVEVAVTR